MKTLEEICLDFLIGKCKSEYFFEESPGYTISMYCLIDEFLVSPYEKLFWFCECPKYCHGTKMKKCVIGVTFTKTCVHLRGHVSHFRTYSMT